MSDSKIFGACLSLERVFQRAFSPAPSHPMSVVHVQAPGSSAQLSRSNYSPSHPLTRTLVRPPSDAAVSMSFNMSN